MGTWLCHLDVSLLQKDKPAVVAAKTLVILLIKAKPINRDPTLNQKKQVKFCKEELRNATYDNYDTSANALYLLLRSTIIICTVRVQTVSYSV